MALRSPGPERGLDGISDLYPGTRVRRQDESSREAAREAARMTTTAVPVSALRERLLAFMDAEVYPNEHVYEEQLRSGPTPWAHPAIMDELQAKARAAGLWNLFLPEPEWGAGLTNLEYAPLCEIMGRSHIAPEVFNCSAPDTGNMEVFARYGTDAHKEDYQTSNGKFTGRTGVIAGVKYTF